MPAPDTDTTHAWLRELFQRQPALDLSSLDICFLVALQHRAQQLSLAAFSEQQLLDTFGGVCSLLEPVAEHVAARATHSLRRLREQHLLIRVDGAGVSRAGEFSLSRLGSSVVDFFVEDEALTPDNLELLAQTLLASLNDVLERARAAKRPREWQAGVVGALRIITGDLILGIERRQRGLDIQQEEFQREIARRLQTDWFGAIERCQEILDSTAATLRQLNQLLLTYCHQFQTILQDVLDLACTADQAVAEAVVHRAAGQIDRIAAWGSARQSAWSEYYDQVHRYLRDVVRLDPARALTQRLREQLNGLEASPFALTVADAPALAVLRSVVPLPPPAPVRRPRAERNPAPREVALDPAPDPLRARVRELLSEGQQELSELTARAIEGLPAEAHFASAGNVAEFAALLAVPRLSHERPWVQVRDGLVIEDWQIGSDKGEAPPRRAEPGLATPEEAMREPATPEQVVPSDTLSSQVGPEVEIARSELTPRSDA